MFDLEQAVVDWRKQMLAAGIKTPVPLEELESHLREEIEQQIKSGQSEQSAFAVAAQRIGLAQSLKAEFKNAGDVVIERRDRMLFLVVFWSAVVWFGGILLMGFHAFLKYDMSWPWRLAGIADFSVIALSVLGWRWLNRAFPVIPDKRARMAIGLSMGAVGATGMIVFMNFILPKVSFTEGQLIVVVLWGLTLLAAFGAVWAGLEEAANNKRTI